MEVVSSTSEASCMEVVSCTEVACYMEVKDARASSKFVKRCLFDGKEGYICCFYFQP